MKKDGLESVDKKTGQDTKLHQTANGLLEMPLKIRSLANQFTPDKIFRFLSPGLNQYIFGRVIGLFATTKEHHNLTLLVMTYRKGVETMQEDTDLLYPDGHMSYLTLPLSEVLLASSDTDKAIDKDEWILKEINNG